MNAERRPSAAAEAASLMTSPLKSAVNVPPTRDAAREWLAVFSAGAIVDFAAYQLEVLDLLPDEALRRIAAIGTDTAVSQAYWLLERRAA